MSHRTGLPVNPFRSAGLGPAFFLADAGRFRAALRMPPILLGGVNRIETVEQALAEGFEFVALGRALLREPELVARWRGGGPRESLCTQCNQCVPPIYTGPRCVLTGQTPARQPPPAGADRG